MLTDPRRFSRTIAALALILGPILTIAGMLATPWEDEATTASYHDALAAHAGQAELAATLLHFGYLLLLPAALGIMHLARRSTPKLAHIGGLLAALGLATLPGLLVTDFYDLALAQALPRSQSVAIADDAASSWAAIVIVATAIAPMFFGLVTLIVAAFRAGVARWWAPIARRGRLDAAVRVRHRHRPGDRRCGADRRRAAADRRADAPDERSGLG